MGAALAPDPGASSSLPSSSLDEGGWSNSDESENDDLYEEGEPVASPRRSGRVGCRPQWSCSGSNSSKVVVSVMILVVTHSQLGAQFVI